MKYIVLTSNGYNFLLEGYTYLFNKYWDSNIQVDVLGFKEPEVKLPDNFNFISLGEQKPNDWGNPLFEYFTSLDSEYFFMAFEDHFISNNVNVELFNESLQYLNGEVDKVYLATDKRKIRSHYKGNFHESFDFAGAAITTSLLPSIWKREFFLKLLEPSFKTPHEFEISNNKKPTGGKVILSEKIIYPNVDAVRRGRFNTNVFSQYERNGTYHAGPDWFQEITEDAIEVFYNMYDKWR